MHRILLTFTLAVATYGAAAQSYFNERYQNPRIGKSFGFTTVQPNDSGYVASGAYYDYPTNGEGGIVLRFLSTTGQVVRNRYYPGIGGGQANFLHRLADGGYVAVAQWVNDTVASPFAMTQLLRFNSLGDTLWTRRYLHGRTDGPITMCVLPDGGFAVAGFTGAPTPGYLDILLARFDANGNRRWWHSYNSQMQSEADFIATTADGGFLLGGGNADLQQVSNVILKTDSLGNEEWRYEFGSPTLDDGSVTVGTQLLNGNYLIAATTGQRFNPANGETYFQHTLLWISPQGQLLRQRTFGPQVKNAAPTTLHRLPDGSVIVAGQQGDATALERPVGFIYKLCPDGDSLLWFRTYKILQGPDSHNYLRDVRPTPDGGFVGAGFLFSHPPDTGANDGWVFKIDSAGYLQAGGAPVTVRCRPLTGTVPDGPAESKIEIYPNPAPDGRFTLRLRQAATAEVRDALGRCIRRQRLLAGVAELDLSDQPPGIYLLRLSNPTTGTFSFFKLLR
jgi:hypothetical protein